MPGPSHPAAPPRPQEQSSGHSPCTAPHWQSKHHHILQTLWDANLISLFTISFQVSHNKSQPKLGKAPPPVCQLVPDFSRVTNKSVTLWGYWSFQCMISIMRRKKKKTSSIKIYILPPVIPPSVDRPSRVWCSACTDFKLKVCQDT